MIRREALKLGLFGGALLAVGGAGLSLWPVRARPPPRRPLWAIGTIEFAVLCAVAARVIPAAADPVEVAHGVDRMVWRTPPESVRQLNQLLRLVENGLAGLLLDARPLPFSWRDAAAQDATLSAMRESRLALRRSGYQVLRRLCLGACYARPERWAETGYPGPPDLSALQVVR